MKNLLQLAVCLSLLLGGCTPKPGPAVSIVNVQLHEMTAFETTAVFTLRLSNDTLEALQLTGGSHKIYINGLYVGAGLDRAELKLPGLATATQAVTVHMNNISLATRIKPIIESKSFEYRIRSTLYSESGKMRSESVGKLELKDFIPEEMLSTTNVPALTNQPAPGN